MDARVRKVISIMEASLEKNPSIRHLAAEVNLSAARLRELFQQETGYPPVTYIKRLRMGRAARLLRTTFLSVKEVASQCGAGDVSHFVRDFKAHHGSTPAQFRGRAQDENNGPCNKNNE